MVANFTSVYISFYSAPTETNKQYSTQANIQTEF